VIRYSGKKRIIKKKTPMPQPNEFIPLFDASLPTAIAMTSAMIKPNRYSINFQFFNFSTHLAFRLRPDIMVDTGPSQILQRYNQEFSYSFLIHKLFY